MLESHDNGARKLVTILVPRSYKFLAWKHLGKKVEYSDGVLESMALSARNDNGQSGAEEDNVVKKKASTSEHKNKVFLTNFSQFLSLGSLGFFCYRIHS